MPTEVHFQDCLVAMVLDENVRVETCKTMVGDVSNKNPPMLMLVWIQLNTESLRHNLYHNLSDD